MGGTTQGAIPVSSSEYPYQCLDYRRTEASNADIQLEEAKWSELWERETKECLKKEI